MQGTPPWHEPKIKLYLQLKVSLAMSAYPNNGLSPQIEDRPPNSDLPGNSRIWLGTALRHTQTTGEQLRNENALAS